MHRRTKRNKNEIVNTRATRFEDEKRNHSGHERSLFWWPRLQAMRFFLQKPFGKTASLAAGLVLLTGAVGMGGAAGFSADVSVISDPGPEFGDDHRLWQGIPSIERTLGGRLVVAWYSGGPVEGSKENYCLLAVSDDQGKSWSPPKLVVRGKEGVRTGEPVPWLDPKGRLWFFWNELHPDKADGEHGRSGATIRIRQ